MKPIKAIIGGQETVTVRKISSVRDTAQVMATNRIGAVPVIDAERLVGIFTERDLLTRVVAAGLDTASTTVGDVMSTELVVAELGESYDVCLQRMHQAGVRHLIVLDQGRLAGILSLRDLLRVDLDEKDEAITLLNAYVHYIPVDMQGKVSA